MDGPWGQGRGEEGGRVLGDYSGLLWKKVGFCYFRGGFVGICFCLMGDHGFFPFCFRGRMVWFLFGVRLLVYIIVLGMVASYFYFKMRL